MRALLVRGGAVWQLVGLITRRSQVQILPPLPFATVCTDLHRVAASGTSCTHPARWSKSASVLATAAFRPRATGHARRKRTLRWREADVRRGTGSGGLARGSLRRHRPPRLRLESLDRSEERRVGKECRSRRSQYAKKQEGKRR